MKKIFFVVAIITTILFSSCSNSSANVSTSSETPANVSNDMTPNIPTTYKDVKVINVLMTTGVTLKGSSTVAYLLLENHDVVIFKDRWAEPPLTKEQARSIMIFQLGDTVTMKVAVK